MDNRIEKAYKDIGDWKARIEKLFPVEVTNSRTFKLEELAMYEKVLTLVTKRLNNEEKFFRRLVGQQRDLLLKQLYPNPMVRLATKVLKFTLTLVRKIAGALINIGQTPSSDVFNHINRLGFTSLQNQIREKLRENQQSFKVEQQISLGEKESLSYILHFNTEKGAVKLTHYNVMHEQSRNMLATIKIDSSSGLSMAQAGELVQGRAVFSGADNWKMLDPNDRDAQGNIIVKEISVPDFDLEKELRKLPFEIDVDYRREIIEGLKKGKQMEVETTVNNQPLRLQLEAAPLKRAVQLFHEGKKFSLESSEDSVGMNRRGLKVSHRQNEKRTNLGV